MSAISQFINTIRTAIYGEQVRGAIADAIEQCYSDVNSPSLMSEGFYDAITEAYDGGILDIQTVTLMSAMTNQNIIYRYNGTEAGKNKGLYFYNGTSWVLIGSEVQEVSLASQMTDIKAIYKYTGSETGMVNGSIYAYSGTEWIPIGSGMLSASSSSEMTNTGAIYKYTGTEAGYIPNALYYYQSDSWVLLSQDTIIGNLSDLNTINRDTVVSAINEVNDNKLTDTQKMNLLSLLKNAVYSSSDASDRYNAIANEFGMGVNYDVNPFLGNTYENRGTYIRNTDGVEVQNNNAQIKYFISDFFTSDNRIFLMPFLNVPLSKGAKSVELYAYTKSTGLYSCRFLVNISTDTWTQIFYLALSREFKYKIVICANSDSVINNTATIEETFFSNVKTLINENGYKAFTVSGLSNSNTWAYSTTNGVYYVPIWNKYVALDGAEPITKMNSVSLATNFTYVAIPIYYPIPTSIGSYDSVKIRISFVTDTNSNRILALTIPENSFTKVISILQLQGVDSITFNERVI